MFAKVRGGSGVDGRFAGGWDRQMVTGPPWFWAMSMSSDPENGQARLAVPPSGTDRSHRRSRVAAPGLPGSEPLLWRRVFPGTPDQAAAARRFARFLLEGTPSTDDAELIVGELAGNALRHTRSGCPGGHFTIEITHLPAGQTPVGDSLLIAVHDLGGHHVPRFGGPASQGGSFAENGRGLAIVAAIARRAGVQGTPAGGHRVWAYLVRHGR
ncbi:hypothetical protein Sru01_55890 [Sphaerisporangium rufum]|uniref:Histidine kinase/HSP90-like ATPase domain-containing protein n=1 Tax=Sphaerisporangium rufum TaxID=1381558 RepID=A0A919V3A8_9ACTN|nr:ATP-binding protein [Sphaerisporangium rufum]GII80607.1 hypothetical protein Sru01_55890 [Sphaerisporangium rufum]